MSESQSTQLQFNMAVPPRAVNLTTAFRSSPSPVLVEKLGAPFNTQPRTDTGVPFISDRLALAVRLAKRDLRHALAAHRRAEIGAHAQTELVRHQAPESNVPVVARKPFVSQHHPTTSTPVSSFPPDNRPSVTGPESKPAPEAIKPQGNIPVDSEEGNLRVQPVESSACEIVRLRRELHRQVQRLRELLERRRTQGGGRVSTRLRVRDESRLQWEEEEEEEERAQRRAEQQAARNTRILYSLQQQVNSLHQDLRTRPAGGRHTKKSGAMQRLAAAHRAAVRTLHHYLHSSSPPPLPLELALLVQQLTSLCSELGVGVASEEASLEHLLQQILDLESKPPEKSDRIALHSGKPPSVPQNTRSRRSSSKSKKTGVLPHSKKHSLKVHYRTRHSTPKSRTPHFAQHTHSSLLRQNPHLPPPRRESPHIPYPPHTTPHLPPPRRESPHIPYPPRTTPHLPPTHSSPLRHAGHLSVHWPSQSSPRRVHFSEEQQQRGTKSPPLPEEDQQPLAEHEPLQSSPQQLGRASVPPTGLAQAGLMQYQLTVVATRRAEPISDQIPEDLQQDTTSECQRVQQPTLEAMLQRLEEFELEEDQIRQKWVSIAFDPLPGKTTTHCEGEPRHSLHCVGVHQSLRCTLPPLSLGDLPLPTPLPLPLPLPLPPSLLSSIHQYQERYTHYLQLTGVNPRVHFDPWKTVERIADELFKEVLEEVATELEQICDGYVDSLYSAEFARPADVHT